MGVRFLGREVLAAGSQQGLRLEWGAADGEYSTAAGVGGEAEGAAKGQEVAKPLPTTSTPFPITAAGLFLDLKAPFKAFVQSYAAPSTSSSSVARDWPSTGGPATFAHMLSLAAPAAAHSLVTALLRSDPDGGLAGPAGLFKWELSMLTLAQAQRTKGGFSLLQYPANPGYKLLRHDQEPLLLGFSSHPLVPDVVVNTSSSSSSGGSHQVKQLFSSFDWDEEMATATVLLPNSVLESNAAWGKYITLCVVAPEGVVAVGESKAVARLKSTPAIGGSTSALGGNSELIWRPLSNRKQLVLDCSIVEAAVAGGGSSSSRDAWQQQVTIGSSSSGSSGFGSQVGDQGGSMVQQVVAVVDVLAPAAVHKDAKVGVKLSQEGKKLVVSISDAAVQSGVDGQGGSGVKDRSHGVELPGGICWQLLVGTKMSRQLGLISVRVAGSCTNE